MTRTAQNRPSGMPHALGAYFIWGLMPIYLRALHAVPVMEFVGWRLVFTLPTCLLYVAFKRQGREIMAAIGNPRVLALLAVAAVLIGANWMIYVTAIQTGHVFAASLGYYINPLVNVLFGTLFLGERLSKRQWIAVAMAAGGVSLLAWDGAEMLGIALTLALSFACYGLVRRFVPVSAMPALTIESALLFLPAAGLLAWFGEGPGLTFGKDLGTDLLLIGSGVITAATLALFAVATRRMDYSTLGFTQYLSPTIVFLLGLFVFHEPLRHIQLVCFIIIWAAIALFVWDLIARRQSREVAG